MQNPFQIGFADGILHDSIIFLRSQQQVLRPILDSYYDITYSARLQYTILNILRYCSLVPRSSNGFCRCFAFQIGKICYHHCIIRHFQFRKCLPVNSNFIFSVSKPTPPSSDPPEQSLPLHGARYIRYPVWILPAQVLHPAVHDAPHFSVGKQAENCEYKNCHCSSLPAR